jgi:HEAT repeat protein
VIIGKPGTGKTTSLLVIGMKAAAKDTDHFPEPTLPIFAHAGDLELPIGDKTDPANPLLDAASAKLSAITAPTLPALARTALRNGNALILLDGFDDLPPPHQTLIIDWLKNFITRYPKARFIATGPMVGFSPLININFVPVAMGSWSVAEFRSLVEKWVATWSAMLTARRRRPKDEIDPALVSGWLAGGSVGRSPLEVTLKIWTGLAGDAEGPRPVDWIETYVKRFARMGEARKAFEEIAGPVLNHDRYGLTRDKWVSAISTARGKVSNASTADPEDVIDELAGRGGLLAKRAGGRITFSHPMVAAYLAAKHVAIDETPETMLAVQNQAAWANALRFYATLANANSIVAQRLNTPPDAIQADLFMISSWLADAPSNALWRPEVFKRLAQFFMNSIMPAHLRARAACALVLARDDSVNKLFKQNLASKDALARQYSAAALGALGDNTAVPELAKMLHGDPDLYVRWASSLALAIIGDPPSIEALGQMLIEGTEGLRRTVCESLALQTTDGHALLRDALNDDEVASRRGAVAGLTRIGPQPWVLELLEKTFNGDEQWIVKSSAEAAIKDLRTPPDNAPQPLPAYDKTGWLITYAAGKGRGVPTGLAARMAMLDVLREGDDLARMAAADHFGRLAAVDSVPLLAAAARENSINLRDMAYKAITNISLATGQRVTI